MRGLLIISFLSKKKEKKAGALVGGYLLDPMLYKANTFY